jgi:hypothetical protein
MKRRGFLKLTLAITGSLLMPKYIYASSFDLTNIEFSTEDFNEGRQTIIVFLAGGPSPLSGNLSNIEELNLSSQQDYFSHFGSNYLTKIDEYDLWKEAGGENMQNMLDNQEMTIIRTCYSAEREKVNNKAHGICTQQNMKGNFDVERAGLLTTLSRIMNNNGKFNPLELPFMTLAGENDFYSGDPTDGLKPVSLSSSLANPFNRNMSSGIFYSPKERDVANYKTKVPLLDALFDAKAKKYNTVSAMNSFLDNRKLLSDKIDVVATDRDNGSNRDKYLTTYGYVENNHFHKTMATAIELLDSNSSTRTITIGTSGLGGWDDHSYCKVNYTRRMQNLFQALEAGMRHLDGIGKKSKVSIMVFGEFGRNVNLNASFGWDHGNLQNLYILGGTDYFNHAGGTDAIVGETVVDNGGTPKSGRVWLKPKEGSYWCEPLSIAATLYAIHGVKNPETLTGGYGVINPHVNGKEFLKV